jgi:hypothetical protein
MTRGSAGALLDKEARFRAVGHTVARGAIPDWVARSGALGHVAAPNPT